MENYQEEKTFSQQQFYFIIGKKKLNKFSKISEIRPLTQVELDEKDKIYLSLWSMIRKYAFQLVTFIKTSSITPELNSELQQELYQIFTDKLPLYDPYRTAPTTFFKPHFINVITKKLNGENISSYDIQNLKKVKAAINYFEGRGVIWTIDMISSKSGLSSKVVTQTLTYGNNMTYANMDSLEYMKTSIPTPEESFIQDETSRELQNCIEIHIKNDDFTRYEFNIFCLRNNGFDGSKEMPYQQIAAQEKLTLVEVRSMINKVLCILQQDMVLKRMYYNDDSYKVTEGVSLCYSPKSN